jgi:hypothetical protein
MVQKFLFFLIKEIGREVSKFSPVCADYRKPDPKLCCLFEIPGGGTLL